MLSVQKHIELTAAHIKKTDEYIEATRAKLSVIKPDPRMVDGFNDVTEKDIARLTYYKLAAEQSWWDIEGRIQRNKKQQEKAAARIAFLVLLTLTAILLVCAMVHSK